MVLPEVTQAFALTVAELQAPVFTSASGTTFTSGVAGSFNITAAGYPKVRLELLLICPQESVSKTMEMVLPRTATLSGIPGTSTGGTFYLSLAASNGVLPNATQSFTLVIDQTPAITSAASTTFYVGFAGAFTITSSSYPISRLTQTGSLPADFAFIDNGNGAATLSGQPAPGSEGVYPLTITADNGVSPDGTQSFALGSLAEARRSISLERRVSS